jgi:hypothetical protein
LRTVIANLNTGLIEKTKSADKGFLQEKTGLYDKNTVSGK